MTVRQRAGRQKRQLMLAGGALIAALATGVLWGVLDSPEVAQGDAIGPREELKPVEEATTTTTTPTSTSSRPTQTTQVAGSSPDPVEHPTTTVGRTTTTRAREGGGASDPPDPPRTAPANQPPIIVDPGISSEGLTLNVQPTLADPENDELAVLIILDGEAVSNSAAGFSASFDPSAFGFSHETRVGIQVTDTSGNITTESFSHTLEAITTVTVSDVRLRVTTAESCFAGTAAQRFGGTLLLAGSVSARSPFSEELRADRTEVVLVEQMTGEVVGGPGSVDVSLIGGLDGLLESYEASHRDDDSVLARMFQGTDCRSFLSYRVKVATR